MICEKNELVFCYAIVSLFKKRCKGTHKVSLLKVFQHKNHLYIVINIIYIIIFVYQFDYQY